MVGVVLLLVVIATSAVIIWIFLKLKQHEEDINKLRDLENGHAKPGTCYERQVTHARLRFGDSIRDGLSDRRRRKNERSETVIRKLRISDDLDADLSVSMHSNVDTPGSVNHGVHRPVTILIHKETANVYGHDKCNAQMMMTAQAYYKEIKNTNEDVPIESVNVVNARWKKVSMASTLFTDDWSKGVPTSFLFNGNASSFEDIVAQNKGMFVHRNIGPEGGHIEVSGVTLDIPEGALDQERLISLGIIWDERLKPKLSPKQTMLSPIVLCQPCGLKFKYPVRLSFPHAAENILTDWVPTIMKREGNIQEELTWTNITLDDVDERVVDDHSISLRLRHFTLYTAVGESQPGKQARKLVHLITFTNKLVKAAFFKPRIYCLNKYKDVQVNTKELNSQRHH